MNTGSTYRDSGLQSVAKIPGNGLLKGAADQGVNSVRRTLGALSFKSLSGIV